MLRRASPIWEPWRKIPWSVLVTELGDDSSEITLAEYAVYVSTANTNRTINNVLAADVVGFRAEPTGQQNR
jgi:hypothetical protein